MARRKLTPAAQRCVADEISRHCHKKPTGCRPEAERMQAVAIAYSICRRRGFRSIPSKP